MKKNYLFSLVILGLVFFSSCAHKVTVIDNKHENQLSGRWNAVDSRKTGEEISEQILSEPWLNMFYEQNNGKRPAVVCGLIVNKSHEHIEEETFIKDIERSFVKSTKIRLVQGGDKRTELRAERVAQQEHASEATRKKLKMNWGQIFYYKAQ